MRLLAACSLGGSGHLQPLLPWLDAARDRGDDVLVIGPAALTAMVDTTGHAFHAGGEPPEEAIAPIRERLPTAPPAEATVLGNRELFGRLAADALLPDMVAVVEGWRPDLILRDPCEYASAMVAARAGLPMAQVAISVAQAEAASIAAAAPALEAHRSGLVGELMASPYLTRFPASLDSSPFPRTIRFHEPPVSGTGAPLPDWWGGGGPLVYLTFGTVLGFMTIAADVLRVALRAVEQLPVRVLLTVGNRFDPAELGSVPPNVHVEPWVDQADVLPEADLVVCHGGSGTVWGSLAAGVPLVVVPVFADQFENGRRVAASGAGRTVEVDANADEHRRVVSLEDAPRIAQAVEAVLGSADARDRAREIAAEMAATPSVGEVLAGLSP